MLTRRILGVIVLLLLALASCTPTTPTPASPTQAAPTFAPTGTSAAPIQTTTPQPTETAASTATATSMPGGLPPGTPLTIVNLHMLDAQNGWGIGQVDSDLVDHILFTQDGGQTWLDRTPRAALDTIPSTGSQAAAAFSSAQHAWVSYSIVGTTAATSEPSVWFTANGGLTWTQSTPLSLAGLPQDFYSPGIMSFLNDNFGWLLVHMGAGMSHDYISIFTTQDGGQNWTRAADPNSAGNIQACPKTGLAFTTEQTGWLTADCPGLMPSLSFYTTSDGGQTWYPTNFSPPAASDFPLTTDLGNNCGIPGIVYASPRTLMLQLRCSDFQTTQQTQSWLYAASNNLNWQSRPLPKPNANASFLSPDEGWLVASDSSEWTAPSTVYHTTDGGQNWQELGAVNWNGQPDFVDAQHGWVIARSGDAVALVRSLDGGVTWEELNPVVAP